MTKLRDIAIVVSCLAGTATMAHPLIDSSEETHASVCMSFDDTADRLVEICSIALTETGFTAEERASLRESLGYAYYQLDRLDEAEDVFGQMQAANSDEPRAILGLAWVAHERGEYTLARDLFRESLEYGASETGLAGLGDCLWELREIELDEVLEYYEAALAMDPTYQWAERQKGWRLLEVNRAEDALALFEAVLDETPWDENARAGVLEAQKALGDYEAAILQADRGLAETPDSAYFLNQRTDAVYHLGRYHQTIRDADRLIEGFPDSAAGYVWRARAMMMLGQAEDALAFLKTSEEVLGADPFLIYWRAWLLLEDGRTAKAADQIERNIARDETVDAFDYELQAKIELERGDLAAARRAVDGALSRDGRLPFTVYLDAVLLLREKAGVARAVERFDDAMGLGLSRVNIGEFAGELIDAGYIAHAIAVRAKYPG